MMMPYQKSETRLCALLIGAIQTIWSVLSTTGGSAGFLKALAYYHQSEKWLFFMALSGMLLIVTSLFPWRSGRHISLFLSTTVWFSSTALWLNYGVDTDVWIVSPTTVLFPLLGTFCLVLLYNEVVQRPDYLDKGRKKERGRGWTG